MERRSASTARTRFQTWVQNNRANGTNVAPQPIYYDDGSSSDASESESTGEDSDDEYLPRGVSRRRTSTATGHGEDGDLDLSESNQAAVSHDISHEQITRQPARRFFFLECPVPMGPYHPELCQLEFFQSIPHDPAATLCRLHFLQFAKSWYMRRIGHSEVVTRDLRRIFKDGVGAPPNYGRDVKILKQARWDERWRDMPLAEFMEILTQSITSAEKEMLYQLSLGIGGTGMLPRCALENCGKLFCGWCLSLQGDEVDLYGVLREARWAEHGKQPDKDHPALRKYERRKREELYFDEQEDCEMLDMKSAYVSVGGLHFIVDVCGGETMIRFQSTKAALAEGRQIWRQQAGAGDRHFYDRKGVFDLTECSAGKNNCACTSVKQKNGGAVIEIDDGMEET